MDSVLRNYFAGGRIRKTETNVFEIRRGFGFPPRRRVREECGAGVLDFGGGGFHKINTNMVKSFNERF